MTHSTATDGYTITEIKNQLLFDEGIAAKGRSPMLHHHIANLNRRVLDYKENETVTLQSDTVNDTVISRNDTVNLQSVSVNSQNDTLYDLKNSLQRIYSAILKNPEITHSEIMKLFHISESIAKRATRELNELNKLNKEEYDKIPLVRQALFLLNIPPTPDHNNKYITILCKH